MNDRIIIQEPCVLKIGNIICINTKEKFIASLRLCYIPKHCE